MSEATIFEFPYGVFLKQRLEFVVICCDHLEASIMRVIEREMLRQKEVWQAKVEQATEAKKTPPREPRDYWVRLSQSQIIARLYLYDSAKLEKPASEDRESAEWQEYLRKKALSISKSTLVKKINSLIDKGFLLRRSKPGDEFGSSLYTLHHAHVQKAMKALPTDSFRLFFLGGVSNFESGGVVHSTTGGESQNLQLGVSNFESGSLNNSESQSQNLRLDSDSLPDSSSDVFEEGEGTGASAPPARAEHPLHELAELRERATHALEVASGFDAATWDVEQTVRASDRVPPFAKEACRAPSSIGDVTHASLPSQQTSSSGFLSRSPTGAAPARTPPAASPAASSSGPRQGARGSPQLTERGAQVKPWLESILGVTISADEDAPDNVRALNILGRNPDVTEESLTRTIALVKALKFVKEHDIAVDVQLLANGTSRLNFEKNWPTARDKQRDGPAESPSPATEPGGYYPYPEFTKG